MGRIHQSCRLSEETGLLRLSMLLRKSSKHWLSGFGRINSMNFSCKHMVPEMSMTLIDDLSEVCSLDQMTFWSVCCSYLVDLQMCVHWRVPPSILHMHEASYPTYTFWWLSELSLIKYIFLKHCRWLFAITAMEKNWLSTRNTRPFCSQSISNNSI